MKKTVGIIAILVLPLLILFSALVFASGNASKGANYPKYALEKAVTHDKKRASSKEYKTTRYQVKFDDYSAATASAKISSKICRSTQLS